MEQQSARVQSPDSLTPVREKQLFIALVTIITSQLNLKTGA